MIYFFDHDLKVKFYILCEKLLFLCDLCVAVRRLVSEW